jgi:hypothetical protein
MLFRLILIVGGAIAAFYGHSEYRLQEKASADPVQTDLAELEMGHPLPNIHVELGAHWKLLDEIIYAYEVKKDQDPESPDVRVRYAYYPLISDGHPHSQAYDRLFEKYGLEASVPESEYPVLQEFAVVVRTEEYKTVGAIPSDGFWEPGEQLVGLVVNDVRKFDAEERALLQTSYPKLSLDRLLIVEEGRKPESLANCLLWMAGGIALVALGVGLMIRATTGQKAEAGDAPPLIKRSEVMG